MADESKTRRTNEPKTDPDIEPKLELQIPKATQHQPAVIDPIEQILATRPGLILEYLRKHPEQREKLVSREAAGRNRTGLLSHIDSMFSAKNPNAWTAKDYLERTGRKRRYIDYFENWMKIKNIANVPRERAEWDKLFAEFMPGR